ncbi:hypothetical protein HNQ59_000549 [Chitinivorax tropicus]|uniref:Alkaline phytoceramidase n=1 Tax=Chitinivorax tropicus TaxID=714531 RepID=A0A840MIE4_9PROT|nr:alkaline phytoceramidase [Chitinivorax tropicus]MBB5017285.1 hypothetical protein [Chitinivorax tropicus]
MHKRSHLLPLLAMLLIACGMLLYGPIPQPDHYHVFADQRTLGTIPHAMDVWSNAGFALIGILGMAIVWVERHTLGHQAAGYMVFFTAMIATAFGSGWYHIAPDNARLVWDRLPIAIACAGIVSAAWAELVNGRQGQMALPWLVLLAALSVVWWRATDWAGLGDLRPYLWLQGMPMVMIPLLLWRSPKRVPIAAGWWGALLCYLIAKGCEVADHTLFTHLHWISGHTLKHLFATAAATALLWRVRKLAKLATPVKTPRPV